MTQYLKAILLAAACAVALVGCAPGSPGGPPGFGNREVKTVEATFKSSHTKAQVKKAILNTTARRGWRAESKGGDVVRATYVKEEYRVVVNIAYTSKTISVSYVSSENLNYQEKNGVATIHSNYNRWVGNIINDVKLVLGDF